MTVPSHQASRRRWLVLALGLGAQTSTCSFLYGLPMIAPQLRSHYHLSLGAVGAVVAAPGLGLLLTLIVWGAVADRFGERWVIAGGMAAASVALVAATAQRSVLALAVLLVVAGGAAASVNAASGRMVLGWFRPSERGLAMGVRQTGQPFGVGLAALVLPPVARLAGLGWALAVPAAPCGVFAVLVAVWALDPPRPPRPVRSATGHLDSRLASPYREPVLWRLHCASAMLVVPQFVVSAFSMVYLVDVRHWPSDEAGRLLFGAQVLGAAGRIGSGVWSDRVGSRLTPMRQLAVASAVIMLAGALGDHAHSAVVVPVLVVGAIVTVADNGLAFTSVAEIAGPFWAGRALGVQNTGQNVAATLTPPLLGLLITAGGYSWGFAVAAVFPVLAVVLTPVGAERARLSRATARAARAPGPVEPSAPGTPR